jgi:hypothetical protein
MSETPVKVLKTADMVQYRKEYYLKNKNTKYKEYQQKKYVCHCCGNKSYKSSTVYQKHCKTNKHKHNFEIEEKDKKEREYGKLFHEFLKTHFPNTQV